MIFSAETSTITAPVVERLRLYAKMEKDGRTSTAAPRRGMIQRAWLMLRMMWYLHRRRKDTEGAARRALANLLMQARGPSMKAGQWLGTLDGDESLKPLVDSAEPWPLEEIQPVIEQRLGARAEVMLSRVEPAFAAASVGQVHRVRLRYGGDMVVKVLYPGVAEAVASELALLRRLPAAGPLRRFGFDLEAYMDLLEKHLNRELDTINEAHNQELFRQEVQQPGLVVPVAYPHLGRPGLLFQAYEGAQSLETAQNWSSWDRRRLGSILLGTTLHGLFTKGLLHGDLHAGNVACRRGETGPEVVLYDFGCLLWLDERRRLALLRLIIGLREGDGLDVAACLVELGFDGRKLLHLAVDLTSLCRLLFEPFLLDRSYDLKQWRLRERLSDLLGELRWWLRAAGPPDSVFFLRAFLGVSRHLGTLDVSLRWWSLLTASVGQEVMEKARAFEPEPLPDDLDALRNAPRPMTHHLSLRVTEGEEEILSLDLPALEVLHLQAIVPKKVHAHLLASGLDLQAVGKEAYRRGMPPGPVIRFLDGNRCYDLWLE